MSAPEAMREKNNIAVGELPALVGRELGRSAWHTVSQKQVDLFAEATGDDAWIHVDPERARNGPYGGTVAHGFLTLSLVPALTAEAFALDGDGLLVNYGINRVRFPAPLRVGGRVQLATTLNGIEDSPAGKRLVLGFEIRAEGLDRPVAVGETVVLLVAEGGS